MKRFSLILFVLSLHVCLAQNVTVSDVIDEINQNSIEQYVTTLQNFGTRFMLSPKRFEAAAYIKGEFESMGFTDVKLDSFQCHTTIGGPYFNRTIDTVTTQINVIATLQGLTTPEQIYIICGHYDSFCTNADPFETAPGADDDASGTTAVLESARAIMTTGFKPKSTLRFIAFAAEELMFFGDAGSEHYANYAGSKRHNIKLVVNNDMIGYAEGNPVMSSVNIGYTAGYEDIDKVMDLANTYSDVICTKGGYSGADLLTFTQHGYPGVYFEETIFNNDNYHKSTDIIDNISLPYLTQVIKASTAVLIGMDGPITDVDEEILPEHFTLEQNYPNPFNPSTAIRYSIPAVDALSSVEVQVSLRIFDILGSEVETLVHEYKSPGMYEVNFYTKELPSGIYFYTLTAGEFKATKKMMLVK